MLRGLPGGKPQSLTLALTSAREERPRRRTTRWEIRPHARRRRDARTTKTLGIDVGEGVGRRAVSQAQARADSLYHFTSLAMPSEKGVWGS